MAVNNRKKKTYLFIVLSGIFLTNAILAELIGVKVFSGEATLGFEPANLNILGYILDFNLTAGVVIWPIVFITTDIINEYFGKEGVKKISFLTAGFIAYIFVIIYLVTLLTPADFWLEVNSPDDEGNAFNIDYAFTKIFRQGLAIIIGSLTAFLLGQLLDVFIFQRLRRVTGSKMIWLRATGSTLASQVVDSFVVLFIAFYIFGAWDLSQVTAVASVNYIYKFIMAILLTPLLYLGHFLIDKYLGKDLSHEMTQDAMNNSKGFF